MKLVSPFGTPEQVWEYLRSARNRTRNFDGMAEDLGLAKHIVNLLWNWSYDEQRKAAFLEFFDPTKEYLTIEAGPGSGLQQYIGIAKLISAERGMNVQFDFNGKLVVVNADTDEDKLMRDWRTAWTLKWKTIGPNPVEDYSDEIKLQIGKKLKENEALRLEAEKKEAARADAKKGKLIPLIEGVTLELLKPEIMQQFEEKNTDAYGGRCVSYAKEWGKAMQAMMAKGKKLHEIAEETSRLADYDGISGFMYGAAVSILVQTWKHGEELKKWHNKEYDYEGEGTANPAVITIG